MATPSDSAPQEQSWSSRPTTSAREPNVSYADLMKPGEDWTSLPSAAERRKIQNRLAQRAYRRSLRDRNQEVQRLKKQVEQLEAAQVHRRAGSNSAEPDASASPRVLGSPEPASPLIRPRHPTTHSTATASDWMGDYLQVWEPPAESEEQSFLGLGLMDQQLASPEADLLDVEMDQGSLWSSVPEPVVACTAGQTQTVNPRSVCSRQHTGDEKPIMASSHIPLSPPLSNRSHHPSPGTPGRTPPVQRTVGPSYFDLYGNDDEDNALDLYMADGSSSYLDQPILVNRRAPLELHHRSSSSSTSHATSCCCHTGHATPSTRTSSLHHGVAVGRADEQRPETNTLRTQLPIMHGLVLARRADVTGHDNQTTADRRRNGDSYVLVRI